MNHLSEILTLLPTGICTCENIQRRHEVTRLIREKTKSLGIKCLVIWILVLPDQMQRGPSVILHQIIHRDVCITFESGPGDMFHCILYELLDIFCIIFLIVQGRGLCHSCTVKRPRLLWSEERDRDISMMYYHSQHYQTIWTASLWSEDEAYLWSDDGQSTLWIMMYDCGEAGEQTSHTFGSFTCERSLCCRSTLSPLCSV